MRRLWHPIQGGAENEIRAIFNLYKNAFKHTGENGAKRRGHEAALEQFHDEVNDFLLYVCVEDYLRLRGTAPVPFQVFQVWFCAVHSDRLGPDWEPQAFIDKFPGILECDRCGKKRIGREVVQQFLSDTALLSDPRTEAIDP